MNIRTLYSTSILPARPETAPARRERSQSYGTSRPTLRIVRDHVVISDKARELLEEMRQAPGVDSSISTLFGGTSLTDEQAGAVRERISHGYYRQPGVLREVASAVIPALEVEL